MNDYKPHEFANIFPMMGNKEHKELTKDIKQYGQQDPIILFEGRILDGRNRFKACKDAGVEPTTIEFKGKDALQYVMSTNLKRRHLTDSQKAVVGRRYKVYYSKIFPQGKNHLEPVPSAESNRDKAGEVVGVSGRYIDMADVVIEKNPELEEKIMSGEIKVKTAYREIKLEEQRKEVEKIKEVTGEYDVIVIDPPWDYGNEDKYDADNFRGTCPYPVMSLTDIKNIKLPDKDNCVLWLWTTNKFIYDCKDLLERWGFESKTILTWDKELMGTGRWLRSQTEHCILAIKGKPFFDNKTHTTLLREKRTTHSKKPDSFYKMVDKICAGRKLDYFARKKREGWDVYGDEV